MANIDGNSTSIRGSDRTYQAYQILHWGFFAVPLIAGLDKFAHILVNWTIYLNPVLPRLTGLNANLIMTMVGVIEIVASILVAIKPSYGGYVVMLWLWGIALNLVLMGNYYDIALRDFALSLGALALARLSITYERAA